MHGLSAAVAIGHACAAFQQPPDDCGLLFTSDRGTTPSPSGGLHRKM
jgi:hypothetical protein